MLEDQGPWLQRIQDLFGRMDAAYEKVASAYGFQCRGCEDNCCYSRFYHHTLLEYLYLRQGFLALDSARQKALLERAETVVREVARDQREGRSQKRLCPLNEEGLCVLYAWRPMVCRLHGLAHELCKPGQAPVRHRGCDLFDQQTRTHAYLSFDRTPFYMDMAHLERALRLAAGVADRMKHTIAEMLLL